MESRSFLIGQYDTVPHGMQRNRALQPAPRKNFDLLVGRQGKIPVVADLYSVLRYTSSDQTVDDRADAPVVQIVNGWIAVYSDGGPVDA
jgi:hypothetical protein